MITLHMEERDVRDLKQDIDDPVLEKVIEAQLQNQQQAWIDHIQDETHEWRMDKWPDVTPMGQTFGTSIELMELGELLWKAEHYDEDWADEQRLEEEAGDVLVYLLGVMSLLEMDASDCIRAALDKNDDRNWEDHMEAPSDD